MLRTATDFAPNETRVTTTEQGDMSVFTDRRTFRRVKSAIRGKFLLRAPDAADGRDCIVTDISLGGACIECANAPPVGTEVYLNANGFENIAGTVARVTSDGMVIGFDGANDTREQIAEKILSYLGGRRGETLPRRHERLQVPQARQFTRPGGEVVDFVVIDLSLSGAYLGTKIKPPVGELLVIGKSRGRIMRHLENGIAIEFVT